MTTPKTDSFEEWWKESEVMFFGEQDSRMAGAMAAWNASREDAEKKIEALKEEGKELQREIIIGINLHAEEIERSSGLKKKIEILTKALELYGNSGMYDWVEVEQAYIQLPESDLEPLTNELRESAMSGGKRARKVLA